MASMDASQNDDAKGKIQFYHEWNIGRHNTETVQYRDLQNSVQKCMYYMNCSISTINFKVLLIF